jgi:hypothetical protein
VGGTAAIRHDRHNPKPKNQLKKGNMSEEKKEVDVRDLKPTKDAKGGRRGHHVRPESGGHQGADRVESALGGKRCQP